MENIEQKLIGKIRALFINTWGLECCVIWNRTCASA